MPKLFKKDLVTGTNYAITFTVTEDYNENNDPIMATYVAVVMYNGNYDNFINEANDNIDAFLDENYELMELEGIFEPYEEDVIGTVREIDPMEY